MDGAEARACTFNVIQGAFRFSKILHLIIFLSRPTAARLQFGRRSWEKLIVVKVYFIFVRHLLNQIPGNSQQL